MAGGAEVNRIGGGSDAVRKGEKTYGVPVISIVPGNTENIENAGFPGNSGNMGSLGSTESPGCPENPRNMGCTGHNQHGVHVSKYFRSAVSRDPEVDRWIHDSMWWRNAEQEAEQEQDDHLYRKICRLECEIGLEDERFWDASIFFHHSAELMRIFRNSDMVGCRYFFDTLKVYADCLRDHAVCVLYKDVYPVLSERYGTTENCIDMAIRRWLNKTWKSPEMQRFFFRATDGKISGKPTNKRLIHVLACQYLQEEIADWSRRARFGGHGAGADCGRIEAYGASSRMPDSLPFCMPGRPGTGSEMPGDRVTRVVRVADGSCDRFDDFSRFGGSN